MDEQTLERSRAAIRYYREEIDHWPVVPFSVIHSRERLSGFVQHDLPFLVDKEIAILRRRVNLLKGHRLGIILTWL